MTSTVFTSGGGGYKLDTPGKGDLAKPPSRGTSESWVLGNPGVLGNIHNSGGGKAKAPGLGQGQLQVVVACRPGGQPHPPGLGEGQEENWGGFGAQQQTPLTGRPTGGDSGSPAKSKTLLGQNNNNGGGGGGAGGKMDPAAAVNGSKPPREDAPGGGEARGAAVVVGAPPSGGQGQEGKRGGVPARKGTGHSPPKSNGFRQILLLQLELIEQQQLQLQNKSKEIDDLKAEKETLLARIERMERRLQLGKKEGSGEQRPCRPPPVHAPLREDPRGPGGSSPGTLEGRGASPEGCGTSTGATPRRLHFGRGGKGHKRRFLFQDPRSAKRRAQAKSALQREALKAELAGGAAGEEEEAARPACGHTHAEEPAYLTTEDMYLSRWHQPPPSPRRDPSPPKEESVAIPSWRENIMDPLEEEEGADVTENMDDGVFLKRHSKHELDEKRRKRWDIQRIREQRMFQRLQQRMNKRQGLQESEPEVLSFYPEAEDVEALMITPHLPVVAFGRPLPKLTRRSFDLPWLDERSRCRADGPTKQTPHRTCRK